MLFKSLRLRHKPALFLIEKVRVLFCLESCSILASRSIPFREDQRVTVAAQTEKTLFEFQRENIAQNNGDPLQIFDWQARTADEDNLLRQAAASPWDTCSACILRFAALTQNSVTTATMPSVSTIAHQNREQVQQDAADDKSPQDGEHGGGERPHDGLEIRCGPDVDSHEQEREEIDADDFRRSLDHCRSGVHEKLDDLRGK